MATAQQYAEWLVANQDKKGSPEFDTVAQAYKVARSQVSKPKEYDPTADMSTGQKVLAGVGKAFVDIGRGAGQAVGLVSREDVKKAREIDAPLMRTTAGTVGNVAGNIAALAPTAFVPGANTLTGAAAIGGVSGLFAPSESTKETLSNTGVGAAVGPAAILAGRGLAAGYQGAKALVEPFYKSGQDKIASRVLQRFASDPQAAAVAARNASPSPIGSLPTLPEAAKDVGLAQLQRGLQSADPNFATALTERQMANNGARVNALRAIAGDDDAMKAAIASRESAANALYGQAFSADSMRRDLAKQAAAARAPFSGIGLGGAPDDLATPGLRGLMNRPMFKQAADKAVELARNKGVDIGDPLQSLQGLHYIKLALDDMASPVSITTSGMGKNASAAVNDMRTLLAEELGKVSPLYGNARQTFADMSKPINQMEVGNRLLNQFTSATNDLSGAPKLKADAFNRGLRNEEQLVRQATGFKGNNGLADVMTPEQLQAIRAVADEIGLQAAVDVSGKAVGSNTAQNLASQNLLRQLIGPTGMPQSWAENTLLMTMMRPVQFAAKVGEPKIANRLAEAMLNPREAAALLEMTARPELAARFGKAALPWLPSVAVGVANSKQ